MKVVVWSLVFELLLLSGAWAENPSAKDVAAKMLKYEEFNVKAIQLLLELTEQLIVMEMSSLPQTPELIAAQREIQQGMTVVKLLVTLVEQTIEEQRKLWDIPKDKPQPILEK